ncbi:pilus assembly FimT family protein [Fundidesulfovibrio soli]|uniref:pilus assembly FimT family protein n=1 Tax=Fundidesulfovibrio soli TaxID=2922716 RepID=UPI001FAF5D96|nr:type II secretion system protein [Fundidesulfovibrio soli]
MRSFKRTDQHGFTLWDTILTLVLVAMLSALALARYSKLNSDAISDAETLKSNLRYAHTRAMTDIYTWQVQVDGQNCTVQRNAPVPTSFTLSFSTAGVAAGTTTFDNRGRPSGTMSYVVAGFPQSPVTITTETGFIP